MSKTLRDLTLNFVSLTSSATALPHSYCVPATLTHFLLLEHAKLFLPQHSLFPYIDLSVALHMASAHS